MTEEIVYANLKFQDTDKKENIQKSERCGGRVYTTLETEMIKSSQLQNIKEELQRNVSLQLMHDLNSSKKIGNLSAMLQKIATQLCRELYKKEPEHQCKPCPKGSKWFKDSCYSKLDGFGTWQKSGMLCSARNASLLKIKNRSELEFVKSEGLHGYWLGLLPRKNYVRSEILNENMFLSVGFERSTYDLHKMYCGYLEGIYVYYTYCTLEKSIICEETASKVQVESVLNDLPQESV
ncbi:C-type lectin domain family 12 member A isoform X2 [Onychomys torridus]|uniref:C-type lectin domain family 12 member A isoform X2 n=1 Tax=Onychomys torridus TaxID=38674 RepID=UPI00167FAB87|nr:C-type lectin domain family 12 member A isoform X2 [Onychomys torridus]